MKSVLLIFQFFKFDSLESEASYNKSLFGLFFNVELPAFRLLIIDYPVYNIKYYITRYCVEFSLRVGFFIASLL